MSNNTKASNGAQNGVRLVAVNGASTSEDAEPDEGTSTGKGPKQSTVILKLLREQYRPLLGEDGRPWAVAKQGPNIALPFRGTGGIRTQVARLYHEVTGGTASTTALAEALTTFEGYAETAEPEPIHLRVARLDTGTVIIDQGTPDGRCIIVGPDGWHQEHRSPVLFRRTQLTKPMPDPKRPGTLAGLRDLLNVDDADFRLIVGFMIAAFLEDIPHPILGLFGYQGTAKSTATRLIVNMINPSNAPAGNVPRDPRDWVVSANAAWALGLDNLSAISQPFSDTLCRASTGDAMTGRALFTDTDVTVIAFRRVVVFNGIDTGGMAGDLAERMIRVELKLITVRREEREVKAAFDAAQPYALAALFDLLSQVLKVMPKVTVADAPRMADFARVLAALDEVAEWKTLDHYRELAEDTQSDALSSFGEAVRSLAYRGCKDGAECTVDGPQQLIEAMAGKNPDGSLRTPKDWPDMRNVKARIMRDTPALATYGVTVAFGERVNRKRPITITYASANDRS